MKKTVVLSALVVGVSASLAGQAVGAGAKLSCKPHAEKAGCPLPAGAVFSYTFRDDPGSRLRHGIVEVYPSGSRGGRATAETLVENFAVPCTYLGTYNANYRIKGKLAFGSTLRVDGSLHARHTDGTQHAKGTIKIGAKTATAKLHQTFTDPSGKVTCDQQVNLTLKRGRK